MTDPAAPHDFSAQLKVALVERLDARDRAGAVDLVLSAVREERITIPDLYAHVLSPVLADLGSAWQRGEEQVWEEHVASHIVGTIVEALYPDVRARAQVVPHLGKGVLLACPPQERHELGLRMISDLFELSGWHVTYLGGDVPADQIVAAARATGVELVALSVSTVFERVVVRDLIDRLRAQLPGVRIAVGGPAIEHDREWPAEDRLTLSDLGLVTPGEGA